MTTSSPKDLTGTGCAAADYFTRRGVGLDELATLVEANPSLRAFVDGYLAEDRLRRQLLSRPGVRDLGKPDDHDRSDSGDRVVVVDGLLVRIEAKSLQSASITHHGNGRSTAVAQVDGSDCRDRVLPDGTVLRTTCLPVGTFDILAVNCFELFGEWRFAFARNDQLRRSTFRRYSETQRNQIIASSQHVTLVDGSFTGIFRGEPWSLIGELAAEGKLTAAASPPGVSPLAA